MNEDEKKEVTEEKKTDEQLIEEIVALTSEIFDLDYAK